MYFPTKNDPLEGVYTWPATHDPLGGSIFYGGAFNMQHGIDFMNSKTMEFHVWALETTVNVRFETTCEEHKLTLDLFIMVLRLACVEKP
jgi:hypothetical protein